MIEVLLVDDESYVTETLRKTIPWDELGISSVYEAESGAEALELLQRHPIDILITDIQMPEMSGLTLIEKVQSQWPHVRSMLLTGHSEFHYAQRAIQLQAFAYVLKPVEDEKFIAVLSDVIAALQDEWAQSEQYYQLMYDRRSELAILRKNLLHELLLGRPMNQRTLEEKLGKYEISLQAGRQAVMMLIQPGAYFSEMDPGSITLLEYAIGNIAEEVLAESFLVWYCQSPHDCLTILVMLKPELAEQLDADKEESVRRSQLEKLIPVFRRHVNEYLKGDISVVVTRGFAFPEAIAEAYRSGLRYFYLLEADQLKKEIFLDDEWLPESKYIPLEALYQPPTLLHLVEAQQWDAVTDRLAEVFDAMVHNGYTRENLYEVYLTITSALMHAAHKKGQTITQLGIDWLSEQNAVHSLEKLRRWANRTLQRLQEDLVSQAQHTRHHIVHQVKRIVARELGHDLSVKSIADRVYLHPVYLSKVFKAVTGESLGDYIIRIRMEKALYMLKHTNRRIYEITTELGYQNPQYFSKMFKKYYGMTPQEYRES